jgi:hypothetical protein
MLILSVYRPFYLDFAALIFLELRPAVDIESRNLTYRLTLILTVYNNFSSASSSAS